MNEKENVRRGFSVVPETERTASTTDEFIRRRAPKWNDPVGAEVKKKRKEKDKKKEEEEPAGGDGDLHGNGPLCGALISVPTTTATPVSGRRHKRKTLRQRPRSISKSELD